LGKEPLAKGEERNIDEGRNRLALRGLFISSASTWEIPLLGTCVESLSLTPGQRVDSVGYRREKNSLGLLWTFCIVRVDKEALK
jgi:hypothetical protein